MKFRKRFPDVGELIIGKVTNITGGYVEVKLEDYLGLDRNGAIGMVHISELSNRWVKNINNLVSIGMLAIFQVLRVNEERGYLDLSLRRVNKLQKKEVMDSWRYGQKIEGLLKFFAEKHELSLEELYKNGLWGLIDQYGTLRAAFEDIKESGIERFDSIEGLKFDKEIKKALFELIIDNVTISKVKIIAEYDIRSEEGNGVEIIQKAIIAAEKLKKDKSTEVKFTYIGAPIYRMEIEAKNFPDAEHHLTNVTTKLEEEIGNEGIVELYRDDLSNQQ